MRASLIGAIFLTAAGVAACTTYYDGRGGYGGYRYSGDYDRLGNGCRFFEGSGGARLDPWLACTPEGRDLVRLRFDGDRDRRVTSRTAERANVWFRRHADTDRDRRLTDAEIRAALVNAARYAGR